MGLHPAIRRTTRGQQNTTSIASIGWSTREKMVMTEQAAGGYSVIVCHYCHQPVSVDTGTWLHLDDTPLCGEESSNEVC